MGVALLLKPSWLRNIYFSKKDNTGAAVRIILTTEKTESKPVIWFWSTLFPDTGSRSPPFYHQFHLSTSPLHLPKLLRLSKEDEEPVGARQILEELITRRIIQRWRAIIFKRKHTKDKLNFLNARCPTSRSPLPSGQTWIDHAITIWVIKYKGQRTRLNVKEMQVINTILGKPFYMLELYFP